MRAGVDILAGFGMSPEQAAVMVSPIGKAATAYRAEIADLAAASYANFNNLKVPINQTALALDAMAKAGKDGGFELKDMAQYFPSITAQAQALGQTGVAGVADLAAALEVVRGKSGTAEEAATRVQDLLAGMHSKAAIENFKAYGKDLPAALKKAQKDGTPPLEAIAKLTDEALGGHLENIPLLFRNLESAGAVRALIQNMEQYRQIRADAMKSAGTVDTDFAKRSQTAGTQARALLGDLQHLAIVVGSQLLPPLVTLADKVMKVADKVMTWTEKHPKLTSAIVQGVAALVLLKIALGGVQFAFGSIVGPAMGAYNALKWLYAFGEAAGFVAAGAPLMEGAFIGLGAAMDVFGAGLAAAFWPVTLIVAAIAILALAAYWVIKHWEPVKAFFGAFFGSLYESFKPVIDFFVSAWKFLTGVFQRHTKLIMGIMAVFNPIMAMGLLMKTAIDWIKKQPWFADLGKWMLQGLINGIYFMLGPLGEVLRKAVDAGTKAYKAKEYALAGGSGFDRKPRSLGYAPLAMRSAAAGAGHNITVHAAANQNPHDIAKAVSSELDRRDSKKATAARSAYRDDDS